MYSGFTALQMGLKLSFARVSAPPRRPIAKGSYVSKHASWI